MNVLGVALAILLLAVAGTSLAGNPWFWFSDGAKWAFAGFIAVVGVVLLLTALPGRRRG